MTSITSAFGPDAASSPVGNRGNDRSTPGCWSATPYIAKLVARHLRAR
jgi:hypothetical protein